MSSRLTQLPVRLPGATAFSDDREAFDVAWVIRTMKSRPDLLRPLRQGTSSSGRQGRPRHRGDWCLIYLAFTCSGYSDIEPWWAETPVALWREAGFKARPSYPTTWERFSELEEHTDAFRAVAHTLIKRAVAASGGLVGRDIHVDATEAETNARLAHDCPPGSPCRRRHSPKGPSRRAPGRIGGHETTGRVRADRHQEAARPVDDAAPDEPVVGEAEEVAATPDGRLRVKVGGCWYRSLDPTAGVRAYTGPRGSKKFWVGFYAHKVVDHYTGAPLAVMLTSASVQEHASYPELLDRTLDALGTAPRAMVADRGFSVGSVFQRNSEEGIASVIPWRAYVHGDPIRKDRDRYDRHGVPRCRYCGGETEQTSFTRPRGTPRLVVRCRRGTTPECQTKRQTIACSEAWRYLVPLARTTEAYHALRKSHANYERTHRHWRQRYRVGPDTVALRPCRRGIGWQQLRADAALLCEWLRICWREGWLGSARRNARMPKIERAQAQVRAFLKSRKALGLTLPYGPAAIALGLTKPMAASPTVLNPKGKKAKAVVAAAVAAQAAAPPPPASTSSPPSAKPPGRPPPTPPAGMDDYFPF